MRAKIAAMMILCIKENLILSNERRRFNINESEAAGIIGGLVYLWNRRITSL